MQFYGVLVLMVTLSTAWGLRCYVCSSTTSESCTNIVECPSNFDSCATATVNGATVKSCAIKSACISPLKCCQGDLCNGANGTGTVKPTAPSVKPTPSSAITTGSSVLLLLVSSAIITLFL